MEDQTQSHWVNVGHSADGSAYHAGISAARTALEGGIDPKLLMVFASFQYQLRDLLDGVAEAAGAVPVIGCSTAAEIGPGPPTTPGVVAVGLGGDFQVTTGYGGGLSQHSRRAGEEVARALQPLPDKPHRLVIMLADAFTGDQQEMIRGAYGLLGATVPLVGGGAGNDKQAAASWQFFGGKLLQDTVVAAAIGSDKPVALAIRHGWHPEGDAMIVTASEGTDVHALDDRPALDAYLAGHGAQPGVESDPAAFAQFALARPLAVTRRSDVTVRQVLSADLDSRALRCAGSVPRGATVRLASGDVASTLQAAELACAEAIQALDDSSPVALLVFDCAGRRAVLRDQGVLEERRLMQRHAGAAAVAGFYTYGEIARIRGASGFHNQTIVAVALG